ncbi:hypothetical protein AGLY_011408 [Aphis glycines]|uniref:Uncharacterized protein n=1 Tax=Aphis glycines TaxID=307491 RepID=A0A6G0TDC5_APHGL|nr:hypothetical protein AGLY_011408 [Aphis glycines]
MFIEALQKSNSIDCRASIKAEAASLVLCEDKVALMAGVLLIYAAPRMLPVKTVIIYSNWLIICGTNEIKCKIFYKFLTKNFYELPIILFENYLSICHRPVYVTRIISCLLDGVGMLTKGKMPLFLELIDLQTFLPKVRTKVLKVDNRNVRVVLTTLINIPCYIHTDTVELDHKVMNNTDDYLPMHSMSTYYYYRFIVIARLEYTYLSAMSIRQAIAHIND